MATETKRSKIWAGEEAVRRLQNFITNNKLSPTQAGHELGVSAATIHEYLKSGRMPHTADLAVRYLDEKAKDPDGVAHYLLTLNGDSTAIRRLDDLETMTIGGARYTLIPH